MLGTIAALATNVSLHEKLAYDPVKGFTPVTLVATQDLMLLVQPSVPAKSVKELIGLAQAKPGHLTFASVGSGVGYDANTWYGIVAPAATSNDVISQRNRELVAILKLPEVGERLSGEGARPVASTPEEFGVFIRSEIIKWGKVIKAAGIRAG